MKLNKEEWMSKKDFDEKDYFNDNLHFADICNGILFQGVRNILPEELEESDTELFYTDKQMSMVVRMDGLRYWRKQGINIALLGLECQSLTDYHMVFRNMMTESLSYYKQWKKNKKLYSKEYRKWFGKLFRLRNSKEFLSGMTKEDKFLPVIILVINCSLEKWDGVTTLHEMLNIPDELKRYVNNYRLNIFDYNDYDDFSFFKTEVRVIFESLKTAGNEEQMNNIFKRVKKIGIDTARLLESLLGIKFNNRLIEKDDNGKEYIEMCKAWDDHWKSGEKNGIAIGIEQTLFRLVLIKVKKNYTLDMIADDLEEDVEVIRPIYEAAKKQLS